MTKIKTNKITDYVIHNKDNFLYKSILYIFLYILLFLIVIFQPQTSVFTPKEGDVMKEDIIADKDIKYIDKDATKQNEEIIKLTTPPVYILETNTISQKESDIRNLFEKVKKSSGYKDILVYSKEKNLVLKPDEYYFLKKVFSENEIFAERFTDIYHSAVKEGVLTLVSDVKKSLESTGIIIGKYEDNNFIETLFSLEDINDKNKIYEKIKKDIDKKFTDYNISEKELIFSVMKMAVTDNLFLSEDITQTRLNNKLKNSTIVFRKIKQGQVLIRKGDIVTKEDILKIEALNSNKENKIGIKYILFVLFFLIFIFIFSAFFIKLCDKDFFKEIKNNIFISIILIIYVIYLSVPIYAGVDKTSFYYGLFVPISTMALTLVFLYSQILSCFFSIILSIFFFIISGFNFTGFLFIFFSGVCSVFTIAKVKKRTDLLIAGLYMSIINAIIVVLMYLMINKDIKIAEIILIAATNGIVSSILGIGFIAFAEFILNSPTVFRLQELSDTSSTLIKELFDSAVGTYNHSILVSNLAEAAAAEIGANAMLAKVGGLYHDIGKIETPEYFIENQGEINIHNQIKPSMSATVIKAHVKKGVELAKNNRLPEKVIDIINQHHGNGLIKYFFDQALKLNDANKGEIKEDVYRYSGEKPQFVEAAIVMLSDQVEAASRVLKKTSISSVEKMIETIIDERFQEGILDDSGLTLKDLTKIKKVFVKLIVGMYHSRIEYPAKEEKDKDKKEGEENKTND